MYRLVFNSGTEPWEIRLKPGLNSIGRSEDNDFRIDDPSISNHHCQLIVEPGSIRLKDLGSTNGTHISDLPVSEAAVQPGQFIRLGTVELLLQTDAPKVGRTVRSAPPLATPNSSPSTIDSQLSTPPSLHHSSTPPLQSLNSSTSIASAAEAQLSTPAPLQHSSTPALQPLTSQPSTPPDKPVFCKNHYQNLARFFCPKCRRHFCDLCVNTRGSAAGGLKFCKVCAAECLPVAIKPIERQVEFFTEARQAFQYPFRADGWILLLGGTFFFGFLDLANYVARYSFAFALRAMMMRVMIFTFILGCGYLFSYLKKIIAYTAQGVHHMPDWPELTEWKEDIVSPMFQFLMISFFSFGPAFFAWLLMDFWFDVDYPWLVWLVALAGCLYFPMAFLGVAMFDSLVAAHPLFVLGSILAVPREYSLAALVFAGILAFRWLSETLLAMLLRIPLLPVLLSDLLAICLLMVEARILGLLYLSKKRTLRWFKPAC